MVRSLIQRSELTCGRSDQGIAAGLVARQLPEHGTSETVARDILALPLYNVGRIKSNQLLLRRVVRIACYVLYESNSDRTWYHRFALLAHRHVLDNLGTGRWEVGVKTFSSLTNR